MLNIAITIIAAIANKALAPMSISNHVLGGGGGDGGRLLIIIISSKKAPLNICGRGANNKYRQAYIFNKGIQDFLHIAILL